MSGEGPPPAPAPAAPAPAAPAPAAPAPTPAPAPAAPAPAPAAPVALVGKFQRTFDSFFKPAATAVDSCAGGAAYADSVTHQGPHPSCTTSRHKQSTQRQQ